MTTSTTINSKTIKLHHKQYDFVRDDARFSVFIGGIGSGKSYAGACKALRYIGERGGLGMIVAPTYRMLRDATYRSFVEVAREIITKENKSNFLVRAGNSEIIFRSAENPERLRGPNLSWAWIDEGALCHPQTLPIMLGRLREGGRAAPLWITSTPKGRNWLYEFQARDDVRVVRASTKDNPYLDKEFITSLYSSYTGNFAQQELEGKFVSFDGLVYDEFDRGTHVIERNDVWRDVVAGVDEGYTNPSVIIVVGFDNDGRAHVLDEFYKRRMLQGDFVNVALEMARKYNISTFYADPSAAGLIAEMNANGLHTVQADNDVMEGIRFVKSYLVIAGDGRPRLTISPSAANLISEMEMYAWKENKSGYKDEPEKVNDHAADALRYAMMSRKRSESIFLW